MKAPVEYTDGFIDEEMSEVYFRRLWDELNWEHRSPRRREYWTNVYGRDYTYGSGEGARTFQSQETHEVIETITDLLEEDLGFRYEGCFLNGYDGEKTGLEWHADDDPGINHSRPIAVVTLYDAPVVAVPTKGKPVARMLQTKLIGGGPETVESFRLLQGSLLLMHAGMQATHFHRIPKPDAITRPRISLTFRSLNP